MAAVKARKSMELEIEDLHIQMDDISKAKMSVSHFLCRESLPVKPSGDTHPSE